MAQNILVDMRRRIVMTADDRRGYHVRGWPAILILVLLLGGLAYLLIKPSFSTRSGLFTLADLQSLKTEAEANPGSTEAQMNAAFAYAALISQFGGIEKAARATLDLDFGEVTQSPSVVEAKANLRAELDKIRQRVGISDEEQFKGVLKEGLAHTTQTLERQDLDSSQTAALHLARGRIQLQAENPHAALQDAKAAQKLGGDPVATHLLLADCNTDLERYSESIKHLRAASMALSTWANQDPGWEVRLMWAMHRPSRRWSKEKRWRDRRQEMASNVRSVIAGEVQVLQGLEKLKQKTRSSSSTP